MNSQLDNLLTDSFEECLTPRRLVEGLPAKQQHIATSSHIISYLLRTRSDLYFFQYVSLHNVHLVQKVFVLWIVGINNLKQGVLLIIQVMWLKYVYIIHVKLVDVYANRRLFWVGGA